MRMISAFSVLLAMAVSPGAMAAKAVPGEFIVKLKHGLSAQALQGVQSAEKIVLAQGEVLYKVRGESLQSLQSLNQSAIDIIEPNYLYSFGQLQDHGVVVADESVGLSDDPSLADDPLFGKLWGMKNTGWNTGTLFGAIKGMDINAQEAWKLEMGSKDIVIAVIDTGVDYTHPDLSSNMWQNQVEAKGAAGVDDDGNGYIDDVYGANFITGSGDPRDDHGHGSHVSGTIAGVHGNGVGVKGVMANAQIMGLKFLDAGGSGTLEAAIKAIDYATAQRVDIMSNSWGGGGYSELLKQSIERAHSSGIVFVAAAGNATNNNDKSAEYPAGYTVDNVIAVAAHQGGGARASFSNYGVATVHIAAPGTNIVSSVAGGGHKSMSGTSMATPHVSGAVGLLLSQNAGLTPLEVRTRVVATAKKVATLNGTCAAKGRLDALRLLQNNQSVEE